MEINEKSRLLNRRNFLKKSGLGLLALSLGGTRLFARAASSTWNDVMELAINFEIKAQGRRPYVAVWVEDWTGSPVRTLELWMQHTKYLNHLRRWYNNERGNNRLISSVSSPTRRAGQYSMIWDGLDDNGQAVAAGEYYICVEYARENGPYHLVRGRVNLDTTDFAETFLGGSELGDVHVEFRTRA